MGFFDNILGATVKTVLTPLAIAKDAINVVTGEEPDETKKLVKSALNDLEKAVDDITGG